MRHCNIRRVFVGMLASVALFVLSSCGDRSSSQPVVNAAQVEQGASTCDDLAHLRDNWNIDHPVAGWADGLNGALKRLSESATEIADDAAIVRQSLNPDEWNENFMLGDVGQAQQRINAYSLAECGHGAFVSS